jgi:glycerol-3-phosphate dehydrogenase (NAD(P)+)
MNVTIVGAGAWGTALAINAATRTERRVCLWARDAALAESMQMEGANERYLPGVPIASHVQITSDWQAAMSHADKGLVVVGTPMAGLADMLSHIPAELPVLWLCKGFEKSTGRLGHEIAKSIRPSGMSGVLSGPSFALEVAQSQPTALVAASEHPALTQWAVQAFHSDSLRIYTSTDPIGVEVGGAVKNVLAIATGIADGLQLGLNARAALITRGLAEMTRLGLALGARADTFMGLSGLGDLVLTATGHLSRNRQVGLQLAQGLALPDILQALGHVSEGVYSAATVLHRATQLGVDMPITHAVVQVLEGRMSAQLAVQALMLREARAEH